MTSARHAGAYTTRLPRNWRSDARASVRPSSTQSPPPPPLDGRPWPVSLCLLRRAAAAVHRKTRRLLTVRRGEGKRVRATVCYSGWCMCVRVRTRPDRRRRDRRIPISSVVRTASHVSRRLVVHDRATTTQSDNASAAVHSANVRR